MIIGLPSELGIRVNANNINFLCYPNVRFKSIEGAKRNRFWQYMIENSIYSMIVTPYINNTPFSDVPLDFMISRRSSSELYNKLYTSIYEQQSKLLKEYWIKTFKGQSTNAKRTYG